MEACQRLFLSTRLEVYSEKKEAENKNPDSFLAGCAAVLREVPCRSKGTAPVLPRCCDASSITADIGYQAAVLCTAQMCTLLSRGYGSQKDARLDLEKHIWMYCLLQPCTIP